MEEKFIPVSGRVEMGGAAARRMRREGNIPAVIYSEGNESVPLSFNDHAYQMAVRGCKSTQIFRLKSDESTLNGMMALIKDVQIDAVSGRLLHVDFLRVSEGHKLVVTVSLEVFGECLAVKENRAFLNQNEYEIEVECLPSAIPEVLRVDISELREGGSLHASDIVLPAGVTLVSADNLTVVSAISLAKKAAEDAAAEAAATAAASAASAAAAAPAAATSAGDKGKKDEKAPAGKK